MLTRLKLNIACYRIVGYDPFDEEDYILKRTIKERVFDPIQLNIWRFIAYKIVEEVDL